MTTLTPEQLSQWEKDALPEIIPGRLKFPHVQSDNRILTLISEIRKRDEVLKHCEAAMTYAYEDHCDQYYLNVKEKIFALYDRFEWKE